MPSEPFSESMNEWKSPTVFSKGMNDSALDQREGKLGVWGVWGLERFCSVEGKLGAEGLERLCAVERELGA